MKVLVVVDMQNDFIDGPLGSQEACEIVERVAEKIVSFDGPVLLTMDTHDESYMDTQEGRNLPVPHCVRNTDGWQLNPVIAEAVEKKPEFCPMDGCTFYKSSFGSPALAEYMGENNSITEGLEEIVLVGVCTDICVVSNAMLLKAFSPETKITVDASCCAGVTPESHANALAAMKMCQINVENWEGNA